LNPGSYQSGGQGSQLVPEPSPDSFVEPKLALWCQERQVPPSDQQVCWCLAGCSPDKLGMPSSGDKEVKTPSPNPRLSPQKCCRIFKQGNGTPKAFQETVFISMPAMAQQIPIQRLSLKNKVALPYIPLQAVYRSKKQSLTHIWLYSSLLATLSSVLCDLLHVQIL
jgi:hypothetical protein